MNVETTLVGEIDFINARLFSGTPQGQGEVQEGRDQTASTPRLRSVCHRCPFLCRTQEEDDQLPEMALHFPLRLEPGPQQELETTFEELKASSVPIAARERPQNSWISNVTWAIIHHRAMLRRGGETPQGYRAQSWQEDHPVTH